MLFDVILTRILHLFSINFDTVRQTPARSSQMIPYKIVFNTEDFATMFDCSPGVAKMRMTEIRRHFNKPPRSKVTALEVATFAHLNPNEVLKALNREHW
jgi:hypothetical protein